MWGADVYVMYVMCAGNEWMHGGLDWMVGQNGRCGRTLIVENHNTRVLTMTIIATTSTIEDLQLKHTNNGHNYEYKDWPTTSMLDASRRCRLPSTLVIVHVVHSC